MSVSATAFGAEHPAARPPGAGFPTQTNPAAEMSGGWTMNTILFDLDGTLLPMDQKAFLEAYFQELSAAFVHLGYDPEELIRAVWVGTKTMIENDGSATNEERFWEHFARIVGDRAKRDKPRFEEFYRNEFHRVRRAVSPHPLARECVRIVKEKGYTPVLATNPIFPRAGTLARISWAGLDPDDFALITTYEDFHYCKPHPEYYREILQRLGKRPEECVMVGNDVREDMCAARLGMNTFLLTDHLINEDREDVSGYRQGGMNELRQWAEELPAADRQRA